MGDLQIANLGDDRSWRGNAGSQAFEEGVPFRKLRNVHFVFGRVLAKQGKKDVVKLKADTSIMAELQDIECRTVSRSESDTGIIPSRVGVDIVFAAIM